MPATATAAAADLRGWWLLCRRRASCASAAAAAAAAADAAADANADADANATRLGVKKGSSMDAYQR